jgi:N-acetyl-anhydromuramyl-L-alanine amidase AmpD
MCLRFRPPVTAAATPRDTLSAVPEAPTPVAAVVRPKPPEPPLRERPAPLPDFTSGRPAPPSLILVHFAATYTAERTMDILRSRKLSAHTTIERDGTIFRHVADEDVAFHAGGGRWGGRGNVNTRSLGIEIVNMGWFDGVYAPEHRRGTFYDPARHGITEINPESDGAVYYRVERYGDRDVTLLTRTGCAKVRDHREAWKDKVWSLYPEVQMEATCRLIWQWMKAFDILPEAVLGHDHVAPGDKIDPGPHFLWGTVEHYLNARRDERPDLFDPKHRAEERLLAVQSHLARLGCDPGALDGKLGRRTHAAFQQARERFGLLYGFDSVFLAPETVTDAANGLRRVPS